MPDKFSSDQFNKSLVCELEQGASLPQVIKEVEWLYLENALTLAGGSQRKAAIISGISYETFRRKIQNYKIAAVFSLA